MTDIRDEWVEKAAISVYPHGHHPRCDTNFHVGSTCDCYFTRYREDARRALAAVADDIRAQALAPVLALADEWDEADGNGLDSAVQSIRLEVAVNRLRARAEEVGNG